MNAAPRVNAVGDLVLTDPGAMGALAEPLRLARLDPLRRKGPATAAELSAQSAQLEELERFGFVARVEVAGENGWEAVGKGFVFELREDPEGQAAARQLSNAMMACYLSLPERWIAEDEPRLEPEWASASGLSTPDRQRRRASRPPRGARAAAGTPEQARARRVPAGARKARVLAYFRPEGRAA